MAYLIAAIAVTVLGLIGLVLFLVEKNRKYSVKELLLKASTSVLFVTVGAIFTFATGHILGLFVTLGLAFGMLGDVWLDLKYVHREKEKEYTYAGFISFGIGHILYMTGMFLEVFQYVHILYFIIPLLAGLVLGFAPLLLQKVLKIHFGEYAVIATAYSALLFMMTCCGLSMCIATGFQNVTCIFMFAGGLLFTISDLILSGTYFGKDHEKPFDIISNGVTYYLAQYLIAWALVFAVAF